MTTTDLGAAIAIFQSHHIIEVRGGDFEESTIGDGLQTVDAAWRNVENVARVELHGGELFFVVTALEQALARFEEDRLFFALVILEGKTFAGANKEYLADVVLGLGPEDFVSPRFLSPFALMNPLF